MLTTFFTTGKVKGVFGPIGHYYKNICYLNSTRKRVTKKCCGEYTKDKDYE